MKWYKDSDFMQNCQKNDRENQAKKHNKDFDTTGLSQKAITNQMLRDTKQPKSQYNGDRWGHDEGIGNFSRKLGGYGGMFVQQKHTQGHPQFGINDEHQHIRPGHEGLKRNNGTVLGSFGHYCKKM